MNIEVIPEKNIPIFNKLKEFKDFYLAGGTALALQIGHRISVDFDFFVNQEIPVTLLSRVKKAFDSHDIAVSVNNPDELTVFIDTIKLTFIRYPFPVKTDFNNCQGINLLSAKEIAASKAHTIGRRGSYKDYVDIYFILKGKYSNLNDIIDLATQKYANEFNDRLFLEQLLYLDDITDENIVFLKEKVGKQDILKLFKSHIKKIKI